MSEDRGDEGEGARPAPFEELEELTREFRANANVRLGLMRVLLDRLSGAGPAAVDLRELYQAFHRLAGAGGTFGFPAVTEVADRGEELCRPLVEGGRFPSEAEASELGAILDRLGEELR